MSTLKLVRHAEEKYEAWFSANAAAATTTQPLSNSDSRILCLKNI